MSFSINYVVVTDNQIIANEFNNFFVSIGKKLASDLSSNVNSLIYLNSVVNSIVIPTITTRKVRNIISSTKNSSPGWDDVPASVEKKIEYYINQFLPRSFYQTVKGHYTSTHRRYCTAKMDEYLYLYIVNV